MSSGSASASRKSATRPSKSRASNSSQCASARSSSGVRGSGASGDSGAARSLARQHFLYFLPLPQGQGSLRPTRIVQPSMGEPQLRLVYAALAPWDIDLDAHSSGRLLLHYLDLHDVKSVVALA